MRERLDEFFRRLIAAPAARNRDEALDLIGRILAEVEDELTGIPKDPDPPRRPTDGRMYPPLADSIRDVPGKPQVKRFRSRAHNTLIGINGAIEIRAIPDKLQLTKAGADGRKVEEL